MTDYASNHFFSRRGFLRVGVATTALLGSTALAGSLGAAMAQENSVLRVATAQEPGGWGLLNGGGGSEGQNVINHLYDSLVTYDEDLNVVEKLATKWEQF